MVIILDVEIFCNGVNLNNKVWSVKSMGLSLCSN